MKNIIWFGFFAGLTVWSFLIGGLYLLLTFGSAVLQWLASSIPLLGADSVAWVIGLAHDMAGIICFTVWLVGAVCLFAIKRAGIHVMRGARGSDDRAVRLDTGVIDGHAREIRE